MLRPALERVGPRLLGKSTRIRTGVLALVVSISCADPPLAIIDEGIQAVLFVGFVLGPDGQSMPGTLVDWLHRPSSCDGETLVGDTTQTASDGRYELVAVVAFRPVDGCWVVRANPTESAMLLTDSVLLDGATLPFTAVGPLDTVRVDFQLREVTGLPF